jgi:hypothetical protein
LGISQRYDLGFEDGTSRPSGVPRPIATIKGIGVLSRAEVTRRGRLLAVATDGKDRFPDSLPVFDSHLLTPRPCMSLLPDRSGPTARHAVGLRSRSPRADRLGTRLPQRLLSSIVPPRTAVTRACCFFSDSPIHHEWPRNPPSWSNRVLELSAETTRTEATQRASSTSEPIDLRATGPTSWKTRGPDKPPSRP